MLFPLVQMLNSAKHVLALLKCWLINVHKHFKHRRAVAGVAELQFGGVIVLGSWAKYRPCFFFVFGGMGGREE